MGGHKLQGKIYPINDRVRIKSDAYCLTLECKTEPTDKNPDGTWYNEGYYPNLKALLKSACEYAVREELDDLYTVVDFIDQLMNKVDHLNTTVKKGEFING